MLAGAGGAADALEPSRLFEVFWGPKGNPESPLLASGRSKELVAVFARSLRVGGCAGVCVCKHRFALTNSLSRATLSLTVRLSPGHRHGAVSKISFTKTDAVF